MSGLCDRASRKLISIRVLDICADGEIGVEMYEVLLMGAISG